MYFYLKLSVLVMLFKMTDFHHIIIFLFLLTYCKEIFARPSDGEIKTMRFSGSIPTIWDSRRKRAEGEQSAGGSGIAEMLTTAIKDGIAASSALDSPTMIVGGFSVMMQPAPKGSELANQLMEMAPHYLNLLPGTGGTKSPGK